MSVTRKLLSGLAVAAAVAGPALAFLMLEPQETSEVALWATMILGFSAGGAAMRRPPPMMYRLVEDPDGARVAETFPAECDAQAILRAREALENAPAEVWRGDQLVARWG